jgi:hypothetical protein
MKIEVGATLAGVRDNTMDRNVSFTFDDNLLAPALSKMKVAGQPYIKDASTPVTTLLRIPANYYTISDPATMIIKKGWYSGTVVIRPDSVNFLNDSVKTIVSTYALPFFMTAADADTMLEPKRSNVVGLRYENMLFGYYWHGGAALINRPAKSDTTIVYKTTIPTAEANIWKLTTVGPNTLVSNGYFNQTTAKKELQVVLKGTNVYVSAAAGSSFAYTPDGPSVFNRPKLLQNRKVIIKYKYTNAGNGWTYHCTDTLTFRNRLRDGINEWQDENPSHYSK